MNRHWIPAAIAVVLLAGCGKGTKPEVPNPEIVGIAFPDPDWEREYSTDEVFSDAGFTHTIQDSGNLFVMVQASITADAPDNGNRRNTKGKLTVTLNGKPCGWDSYGNEFRTSTAAMNVHCFDRASGPYNINVTGWLNHCCEGGNANWSQFGNRQTRVRIFAFRAEVPEKNVDEDDDDAP